ncbi:MAG: hypothetical protein HYS27_07545 [Deltaproteobacteria bacterium]|nr:hypothetical protein [Deltaproteobacteria bacterium]
MLRNTFLVAVAAVASLAPGCACEQPPLPPAEEDHVEWEPFDTTRVLEGADLASLAAVEADGTLRFDGTPAVLADVARLDVIVAESTEVAPHGLLRFVTSTEEDATGLIVHTLPAPVQMAFKRLDVRLTSTTPNDVEPTHVNRFEQALTVPGGGGITYPLHEPLYDVDKDPNTTDDQVYADGALHGGLDYVFTISFDWNAVQSGIDAFEDCLEEVLTGNFSCDPEDFLPEVTTGLSFAAGADATLALQGVSFLGYDAKLPVYQHDLPPIVYPPLVFLPSITVEATFHGEGTSQFSFEMSGAATASGGISVSSKSGIDLDGPDFDYEFSAGNVDAVLAANTSFAVGPKLSVLLYGFIGPTAALSVGARLEVDRDQSPCYRLFGTVGGAVGVFVGFEDLPGFTLIDEQQPFQLLEAEFDSGDCLPLPNNGAPSATAGSSDLAAFQDPQFTRFARVFPGTVDGMPIEGPGAQAEWSALVPTFDGRFWQVGSDADALVSMNPDGSVAWAKRYTADVPFWPDIGEPKLLLSRAAPMSDGTMLVAAYPYTLLRLDLAGNVLWSRRFMREPFKEVWLRFTDLVRDGAGGFYLVGHVGESYSEGYLHDTWLLHLDAAGAVTWSRRIAVPGLHLTTRALVADADGVLLVGDSYEVAGSLEKGAAVRVDETGALVWATHLVAQDCDDSSENRLWLTSAQRAQNGDVLAGGAILAWGNESAVVRIKPDGSVPFAASHRSVDDAQLGPTLTSMVELPTSGFLVAGNWSGVQATHDWYLAGLDAAGLVQWAFTFGGHDNPVNDLQDADTYPSVTLTKDGGALLYGYTEAITPEDGGLIIKVPARSGEISLDPLVLPHDATLALEAGASCVVADLLTVTVTDDDVAPLEELGVFVEDAAIVPEDIAASP